jgi:hypothetical protein
MGIKIQTMIVVDGLLLTQTREKEFAATAEPGEVVVGKSPHCNDQSGVY